MTNERNGGCCADGLTRIDEEGFFLNSTYESFLRSLFADTSTLTSCLFPGERGGGREGRENELINMWSLSGRGSRDRGALSSTLQ